MRRLWMLGILVVPAFALGACEMGPYQTRATAPTVSYAYSTSSEYRTIEREAQIYCEDRYRSNAYLVDERRVQSGYEVTFACE